MNFTGECRGSAVVLSNNNCPSERKLTHVFKALGTRFPVVSPRGIPLSYEPRYSLLPSRSISDAPASESLILNTRSLWKPKRLSWNWLTDPRADTTKSCLVTESRCCIDRNYSQRGHRDPAESLNSITRTGLFSFCVHAFSPIHMDDSHPQLTCQVVLNFYPWGASCLHLWFCPASLEGTELLNATELIWK